MGGVQQFWRAALAIWGARCGDHLWIRWRNEALAAAPLTTVSYNTVWTREGRHVLSQADGSVSFAGRVKPEGILRHLI